jgi:hypothetical protein
VGPEELEGPVDEVESHDGNIGGRRPGHSLAFERMFSILPFRCDVGPPC